MKDPDIQPAIRGRWLYRGYLQHDCRWLGCWRDTFTPETMHGMLLFYLLSLVALKC